MSAEAESPQTGNISTTVPFNLKDTQGLLRVTLEVIDEHGGSKGQSTFIICDWAEDDWRDAAHTALDDCVRKTNEEILRDSGFDDDDTFSLTPLGAAVAQKLIEDRKEVA